eukprot:g31122.t1
MSDKMLFEGTLVLVAGGAWLRVGSMMATDLSESCRCCGGCCCSCVASELRWWGSRLIFLGGNAPLGEPLVASDRSYWLPDLSQIGSKMEHLAVRNAPHVARSSQKLRRTGALSAAVSTICLSSVRCWTPQSMAPSRWKALHTPRPAMHTQADPLQAASPQLQETRVIDRLPSSLAAVGRLGSSAPVAVRVTQAVHAVDTRGPPQVVVSSKEKSGHFSRGVLDRIKMRLEGQGTYAVISALVVNMGIRLLSGNSPDMLREAWAPVACAYSCALATCVLSGVYATVIFTLTKMYSMTVIGNYKDAQFAEHPKLLSGFWAFCASLGSFAFAFVTFFLLKIRGWPGITGFTLGVAIAVKAMLDFRGIYRRAGNILR